ncbi:hypothetical protein L1887_59560 [Cichorium endivia]|nr:hypothetical protein L1887_59560 [Cichorium endivia]
MRRLHRHMGACNAHITLSSKSRTYWAQKEESTASSAHVKSLDSVKRHTAPDSAVPPGTYLLCLGVAKATTLSIAMYRGLRGVAELPARGSGSDVDGRTQSAHTDSSVPSTAESAHNMRRKVLQPPNATRSRYQSIEKVLERVNGRSLCASICKNTCKRRHTNLRSSTVRILPAGLHPGA